MCTNRPLSADEARALGLVNQVFPKAEFIQRAREFAEKLSRGPTAALGYAKRLVTLSAQSSLETQMEHKRRAIWDAGSHMSKAEWRAACLRIQRKIGEAR